MVKRETVHGVFFRERLGQPTKTVDFYRSLEDAHRRAMSLNRTYNSIHGVNPYRVQAVDAAVDMHGVVYTVMSGENFNMASCLATAVLDFDEAHAHAKRMNMAISRSPEPITKRFYVKAIKVK